MGLAGSDALTGELTREVGEDAGTYAITRGTVDAGDNYAVTFVGGRLTILQAPIAPSVTIEGWTYGDPPHSPTVTGNPGSGDVTCTYSDAADGVYTGDVPAGVGTWYVKAEVAETENYRGAVTAPFQFVISKAGVNPTDLDDDQKPTPAAEIAYTGEAHPLVNPPADVPEGYTVEYSTDGVSWSEEIPTASDEGTHIVYVRYVGDKDHADFEGDPIVVTISQPVKGYFADLLIATMVSEGADGLKLTWTRLRDAQGYDVFLKPCDKKSNFRIWEVVDGCEYTITGLDPDTAYMAYVKA